MRWGSIMQLHESVTPEAQRVARTLNIDISKVTASCMSIGNGQVALCQRWVFEDGDGHVQTAVAKMPSTDESSRSTAKSLHLYRRETSFYRELLPQVSVPTPQIFHVEYGDDDDFLLVMEDLTPSRSLDQFAGLSLGDAQTALRGLSKLHAPTARRTDLFQLPWLGQVSLELAPMYAQILPSLFKLFFNRYHLDLDEATRNTVHQVAENLGSVGTSPPEVACVLHGDFRTDNLIFDGRDGAQPFAVVDWQTISVGSPMADVAYFITTSLNHEDRKSYEQELLNFYLTEMLDLGVELSPATARHEFAQATIGPIIMLVAASVYVERTDRGDAMFLTMIRRAVQAVRDWHVFEGGI